MPTLDLEPYLLLLLERESRLAHWMLTDKLKWNVSISDNQFSLLTQEEQPVALSTLQLIGTESYSDKTWLWAWSNLQSSFPPEQLMGIDLVREYARTNEIPEFATTGPIPLQDPMHSSRLALASAGYLEGYCLFGCPVEDGRLFIAVMEDLSLDRSPRTVQIVMDTLARAIANFTFDHRRAMLAYLGAPESEDGDTATWTLFDAKLKIGFNRGDGAYAIRDLKVVKLSQDRRL